MRLLKRVSQPGMAPGTLPTAAVPTGPCRLRLLRFDADGFDEVELSSVEELVEEVPGKMGWLDVEGHDVALIGELGRRLGIHPLALEDVVNIGQRPKLEELDGSIFVTLDLISLDPDAFVVTKQQVALVVRERLVLTVHEREGTVFDPVRRRLQDSAGRSRFMAAGYLAYALIDTVVDHHYPVLEAIGERLEELEDRLLRDPTPDDLTALHMVKRNLLLLRRSSWPLRDALTAFLHGSSPLAGEEARLYLRDVSDHLYNAVDMIELYRDMVASLTDVYLSSASFRLNEVMKVLTIIATIFIPLSFVAGVFGMNFDPETSPFNMPELRWYWGYPAALALMAAVALVLVGFFRRRGWV